MDRKKALGKVGLGLCVLGVSLAVAAALTSRSHSAFTPILIGAGMMIYIPGGMLASAAYGYRRGSKLMLTLMVFRSIFAASVIFSVMGFAS